MTKNVIVSMHCAIVRCKGMWNEMKFWTGKQNAFATLSMFFQTTDLQGKWNSQSTQKPAAEVVPLANLSEITSEVITVF